MRRPAAGVFLAAAILIAPAASAQTCEHWVAPPPEGNNANPGTFAAPWATLDFASARTLALGGTNCTVIFKDGVYTGRNVLGERFPTTTTFRAQNRYRAILQSQTQVLQVFSGRNMVFEHFLFRHQAQVLEPLVMQIQTTNAAQPAEDIVVRENIFHDSLDNDLLKVNNAARRVTVEGNLFYNQGNSDEHIDVNSVTDVMVQDNVFFNDFPGSGRPIGSSSSFIVVKDSNDGEDGLLGARDITIRRNVFLNWQGSAGSNFVLLGEDGKPYHEADGVLVENNLMIGNSNQGIRAAFGVKGCRNITFRNNTVVGDLPANAYAMRLNLEGQNPQIQNVFFHNNIWSDHTGTMGAGGGSTQNDFSDGDPSESTNVVLDRNLYWNGGAAIPPGDVLSPLIHDARRIVADPLLNTNHAGVVLPRWNGTTFLSGNTTIRQEFERLVATYGQIPPSSPAANQADPALAPADDILGRLRGAAPDLGAVEAPVPAASIADVSVTEGTGPGSTTATFTVTLSQPAPSQVTIAFATAPVTAAAGTDYTSTSGTLTIAQGVSQGTIPVTIVRDALDEPDETFHLNLSAPVNATLSDAQAVGTILDDDPPPAVSIGDTGVTEAGCNSVTATLAVSLDAPSGRTVTVSFATADGTATAGADYTAVSGTLTLTPGTTTAQVQVAVAGDLLGEPTEHFFVDLGAPVNATLGDARGQVTITDDGASAPASGALSPGSLVTADLAGGAPREFRVVQEPHSSYEAVFDAVSGDLVPLAVQRLACSGAALQAGQPIGVGPARSLRWRNDTANVLPGERLAVASGGCVGAGCGADDVFRVRFYDTTLSIPRFNNAGTQVTVLVLQNPSAQPVSGFAWFRNAQGALLGSHPFSVAARGTAVVNTAAVGGASGLSGSITVTHDARYGELTGKTVALEPATGFSFDTPMVPRGR